MTSTNGWSREHPVSLRRQLAAAFEAAIRDGHLAEGARLPSTRDVARATGLHRATVSAAYGRLRSRGWIDGGSGRRALVRRSAEAVGKAPAGPDEIVSRSIRGLLAEARACGVKRDVVLDALAHAVVTSGRAEGTEAPLLYEPRGGLAFALAAELSTRLGRHVAAVQRFPRSGVRDRRPVLLRDELLRESGDRWREVAEPVPLRICGGTRERGLVRRTVRTGLVTLVTVSDTVARYAGELAARDFERGVSFRAVSPRDRAGTVRAVSASRLVLHDEPSRALLPPSKAPAVQIRLVADSDIASLRAYFGVAPARRRNGSSALERPARNLNGSG